MPKTGVQVLAERLVDVAREGAHENGLLYAEVVRAFTHALESVNETHRQRSGE